MPFKPQKPEGEEIIDKVISKPKWWAKRSERSISMSVRLEHNKLKNVVESVLYTDELARSNDDRLYYSVLRSISSDKGINLDQITAPNFFLMRKRNGFPAYTSVVRERRRIQADNSSLQADPDVEAMRELREEEYKEWAVRSH